MKFIVDASEVLRNVSRPARGAWVEIPDARLQRPEYLGSRPARGAWVEIIRAPPYHDKNVSRPARGAWVEILKGEGSSATSRVAPRKGRVG